MPRFKTILLFNLLSSIALTVPAKPLSKTALPALKQQLESIDDELDQLPQFSLRSGTGSVGYQSKAHAQAHSPEKIHIDLGTAYSIDQVVLVPIIRRNPREGLQAEAFPEALRILAGTEQGIQEVATFTPQDHLLPRIAPLLASFPALKATWIEVEATTLSTRDWDQRYAFHLSEIMVFSGMENVALNKPISTSSSLRSKGRNERFLVDGFLPYLMDSHQGVKSPYATLTTRNQSLKPTLTIDLETPFPINQLHFHMAHNLDLIIPNAIPSEQTAPRHFRVTGGNQPDFSDQTELFDFRQQSVYDVGPIISKTFPETTCRYVQIQILEFPPHVANAKRFALDFAEIEILSKGQNVALHKPVTSSIAFRTPNDLPRITDGNNTFGKILPLRDWMEQLARRHQLERERPRIKAAMNRQYERQKTRLNLMHWLAALLVATIIIVLLTQKIIQQKAIIKTRKRIAANLHDELGANLHAIGLLGDTVKKIVDQRNATAEWPNLTKVIDKIRGLTEETGSTARYCSNLLEADHLYQNPAEELQRIASRQLTDLKHQLSITHPEELKHLKPRKRMDLVLFYKEGLTNIVRHAGATYVSIQLTAKNRHLQLCITDDGCGIQGKTPPSLKRRARMLHATLRAESPPQGGTHIVLTLKI